MALVLKKKSTPAVSATANSTKKKVVPVANKKPVAKKAEPEVIVKKKIVAKTEPAPTPKKKAPAVAEIPVKKKKVAEVEPAPTPKKKRVKPMDESIIGQTLWCADGLKGPIIGVDLDTRRYKVKPVGGKGRPRLIPEANINRVTLNSGRVRLKEVDALKNAA